MKIAAGVIGTIVLLTVGDFLLDYNSYRRQALNELEDSATDLSVITMQSIVELAMLGQHPELLQKAIVALGGNSPVREISLLDLSGVVQFSSRTENLGRRYSLDDEGCRGCHMAADEIPGNSIFQRLDGEEVLRRVTAVENGPECHMCHDPLQRWNGILVIDFPTSGLRAQMAANFRDMLGRAGLMTLAVLMVLGLLMNKVVIGRLQKLTRATAMIAQRQEVPQLERLEGSDEIGQLAKSFREMAEHLSGSFRELESQKAYLQELINSLQDGLVVVDRRSIVELANQAALESLGRDEIVGLSLIQIGLATAANSVNVSFEQGEPTRLEANLMLGGAGAQCEIFTSPVWDPEGDVVRVIVLFRNITERKLFEKELSRTERLASVGQLAAGLAHEINNPMAAIRTCAEGLERYIDSVSRLGTEEKHEIRDYLSTIGEAAVRCKEITQRLLSVSADEKEVTFEQVDLADILREVVVLLDHEAERKQVLIETRVEGEMKILGAPKKLFQLLLNLTLNSLEATEKGGVVLVSATSGEQYIELKVLDRGGGIPPNDLEHVFDPFFTTKKEGRGTGLGLPICEGIVRQHQGQISIQSEENRGTEVTVLFPGMEVRPS